MATNCKVKKGVNPTCKPTNSGIHRMAIANWVDGMTATASGTDCLIDTIDLNGEKFFPLNIATNSGTASVESAIGANKDARSLNHIVSGQFNSIDCDMIDDYLNYLLGTVIIAYQNRNRDVYIAGFDNGLMAETFNYTEGLVETDLAGVSFTYSGTQPNFLLKVKDWETITALFV